MSLILSGRCVYPSLFRPAEFPNDDPNKRKYQLTLLIDKSDEATYNQLRAACLEAAKTKWGDKLPARMASPINDGDDEGANSEFAGHWYIRAKTQRKPGVVNQRNEPVEDEGLIASGDYVRISCNPYAYDVGGNRGVALGLNNVQFAGKGEAIGAARPSAQSEFEPLEVGDDAVPTGAVSEGDPSIPF